MATNFKLRIEISKELKSLSGAIKTAKVDQPKINEFWKNVSKQVKKADVDPAWIIKNANEKEIHVFYKGVDRGAREKWSAWMILAIVDRFASK